MTLHSRIDRTSAAPKSEMPFAHGNLRVRLSRSASDIDRAQHFRASCFSTGPERDADRYDAKSQHVLIECGETGTLLACFRLLVLEAADIRKTYSHQFYDLSRLTQFPGRLMELGRFCTKTPRVTPDVLRLAWGTIAALVDDADIRLLFGCTSFNGSCAASFSAGFQVLNAAYLAPPAWRPGIKAPNVVRFQDIAPSCPGKPSGWGKLPPLLRSYLAMGGWVGDHAVIDRHMNTLHVLTGLEVEKIPLVRKRQLRAVLGSKWDLSALQVDMSKAVDVSRSTA